MYIYIIIYILYYNFSYKVVNSIADVWLLTLNPCTSLKCIPFADSTHPPHHILCTPVVGAGS